MSKCNNTRKVDQSNMQFNSDQERNLIIEIYGAFMEKLFKENQFIVYNESTLPYTKTKIKEAILSQLNEYSYEFWEQHGLEMYNALLTGLDTLVWFQPNLMDNQMKLANFDPDELNKLTTDKKESLLNYITMVLDEIQENYKTLEEKGIAQKVKDKRDIMNTGLIMSLGLTRAELRS